MENGANPRSRNETKNALVEIVLQQGRKQSDETGNAEFEAADSLVAPYLCAADSSGDVWVAHEFGVWHSHQWFIRGGS